MAPDGRSAIHARLPDARPGSRLRGLLAAILLAQGAMLCLAVSPARAVVSAPPVFEAEELIVRFAPVERGVAIRAARLGWRDSLGVIDLRGFEADLRPSRATGTLMLSARARAMALGADAPPLRDLALQGTLIRGGDRNSWAVPDLLVRIAGRDALAGAITGPTPPAQDRKVDVREAFRIKMASREPLDLASFAPALAWAGAKGWHASGTAEITLDARILSPGRLEGRAEFRLRGFGFASPGDAPDLAADRLNGNLSLTAAGTLSPRLLRFELVARASDFEFLSGVYYANLAGQAVEARASGSLRGTRLEGLRALLSAPDLGTLRMTGAIAPGNARPGDEVRLEAERLDLERLWPLAVRDPLGDAHPWIKGSAMLGTGRLEAHWRKLASGWTLEGIAETRGLRWERPAAPALLDVPEARLPFHFRSPPPHTFPDPQVVDRSRYGQIRVARFQAGNLRGAGVLVEPLIHDAGLRLRGPVVIPFFGGLIRVEDLEGSGLLEPGRRIRFHGHVSGVDLGAFTKGLGLPELHGSLAGEIPEVRIDGDHLRAPGHFETAVFGGRVTVSGLEVRRLFSGLPRIGMDVKARELNLEQATQALSLGRISGILEGSIRGLVIERGQPESLLADFSVVDRKGVSRWVSADFVEDVATLFGSGNAVSQTLNRGVNRFFTRYRYDAFGFTCSLKNDVFYPRGKIRRDGLEYLMWGRWNYVRIAIRDPGRGIPFSFLVRQMRTLGSSSAEIEQRNRTPLNWLWPPSWRTPKGRPGAG